MQEDLFHGSVVENTFIVTHALILFLFYKCLYCSSVTLPVPTHLFLYVTQGLEFPSPLTTMLSGSAVAFMCTGPPRGFRANTKSGAPQNGLCKGGLGAGPQEILRFYML